MRCAIWYYLYNLKNVKNYMEECCFSKVAGWCFSRFLTCTNGTNSRNASHIHQLIKPTHYRNQTFIVANYPLMLPKNITL